MTDLHETNPRTNPYFRDPRIRQYLLRAGLINRHGDIVRSSSHDLPRARSGKGRRARVDLSRAVDNYVAEEEENRRKLIRNHLDFSVKLARKSKHRHRSVSRSGSSTRPSPLGVNTNEKRSPKRAKSAHHSAHHLGSRFVRRSAKTKSPTKSCCRVIMAYHGQQTFVEYDKSWFQQKGDEILVMQQHCGGENLPVFKGFVKPGEKFAFDSKRHSDYPFALALYINGLINSRISVCCEYKHKKNALLGGPHGSFSIASVQKVKPCLSCRYERQKKKALLGEPRGSLSIDNVQKVKPSLGYQSERKKKKSKSTGSLGVEPSRYRRRVVPLQTTNASSSPTSLQRSDTPPDPSTNGGHSQDSISPPPSPDEDDKKPLGSSGQHHSPQTVHKSDTRNSPTSTSEDADEKKPPMASVKHHSPQPIHQSNTRHSPLLTSEDDDKKPRIPSGQHHLPQTVRKSNTRKSPSLTSEEDDKKPAISTSIPNLPIVPTGHHSKMRSPGLSRTPTPPSETDEKKPPISSARRYSPVVSTSYTSKIQNPVASRNDDDDDDDENYSTDFDKSNDDDDDYVPTNSRYGRPRISDSHSIDKDQDDNKQQSKYSPTPPSSVHSSNYQDNHQSSKILIGKKNTVGNSRKSSSETLKHTSSSDDEDKKQSSQVLSGKKTVAGYSQRSSSSTSKKSGPSKDENVYGTPKILNGKNNLADDSESGPSPGDKTYQFSSTTTTKKDIDGDRQLLLNSKNQPSTKKNEDIPYPSAIRRTSTSSSEDFFGIKRSAPKEKRQNVPVFSKEWFETTSKNEADDDSDQESPSETKAKPKNKFFDDDD